MPCTSQTWDSGSSPPTSGVDRDLLVTSTKQGTVVTNRDGDVVVTATRFADQSAAYIDVEDSLALVTTKPIFLPMRNWHERLGHIAEDAIKQTLKH